MADVPESESNSNARPPRPATPRPVDPPPVTPEESPVSSAEGVAQIVNEIREGLADISARELELRRHEQYFGRRYRELEQAAIRTFAQNQDAAQQHLVQQAAELNAQAVEIAAQRARLKAVTDEIHARQVELEQQRGDLTRRTQQSRQRTENLRSWLQQQHQLLNERRETIRRHEEELAAQVHRFRADAVREQAELDRRRTELDARAVEVAESEQKLLEYRVELERQTSARNAQRPADEEPLPALPTAPATLPFTQPTELPRDVLVAAGHRGRGPGHTAQRDSLDPGALGDISRDHAGADRERNPPPDRDHQSAPPTTG